VKPATIALWIPWLLVAVGVHTLGAVAAWSAQAATQAPPSESEPDFWMRRVPSAAWCDGEVLPGFDTRTELSRHSSSVACSFWKEVEDGVVVRKSHCHFSSSDEFETRARLLEEIAALDGQHAWAGDYFRGVREGHGEMLTLAPSGRTWTRSVTVYTGVRPGELGRVEELAGGRLRVAFGLEGERVRAYCPVTWGDRHYLVEPERLDEFRLHVRTGLEPREFCYGAFFLREDDELAAVSGEPRILGE
jgi:hypothetical protein